MQYENIQISKNLGTSHQEQNLQTNLIKNDFILSAIEPSSIFEMTLYPTFKF